VRNGRSISGPRKLLSPHTRIRLSDGASSWVALPPPKRGESRTAFFAQMLLPGLSISFRAQILGRSRSSITSYRAAALEAAKRDPAIKKAVEKQVRAMRPEDGLRMAQMRGKTHLTYWSRLAIIEFRRRGFTRREISAAFHCSRGTVDNVLRGGRGSYSLFSGERKLTQAQKNPPGKWAVRTQSVPGHWSPC
jgi:hypothetical protein